MKVGGLEKRDREKNDEENEKMIMLAGFSLFHGQNLPSPLSQVNIPYRDWQLDFCFRCLKWLNYLRHKETNHSLSYNRNLLNIK